MSGSSALSMGVLCGLCAACAGGNIPSVDAQLADSIESAYSGGAMVGASGSAGAGDAQTNGGGRGNVSEGAAGHGGAGSANAGASGAAGDGGAAGSSLAANAEAGTDAGAASAAGSAAMGSSGICDGFAILATNCGTSGCHGAGSNLGTFAASERDARGYIGQPGAICAGSGAIIDPPDPPSSLIIQKLSDFPPCGQSMPANGALLSVADIVCIEDWIGHLE